MTTIPSSPRFNVTARSSLGVETLVGDYDDIDLAMEAARAAQTQFGNLSFIYVSTAPNKDDGVVLYSVRASGGP